VLTRFADVAAVLRDPTVSVELDRATPTPVVALQLARQERTGRGLDTLVLRDDPDHQRLRRLMQRPFGPRAVEGLRAMVTRRVDAAMDALAANGSMDVIGDFAYPLPVAVVNDLLGLPEEDAPRMRAWINAVARALDPIVDDAEYEQCQLLVDEWIDYVDAQVEAKRRRPGDDALTVLVEAEEDGDRLTAEELVAQVMTLYVAGHEPTMAVVGNGLLALLDHPDQLARLRAEPGLLPGAVHELMRYDGPNQFLRRIALAPLTLREGDGARTIAAGDVIYPGVAAANRDPARWPDPDRVVLDRPDAAQHLQFGGGAHYCLGNHLGRLMAEVALGALVRRLDGVALDGEPVWSDRMVLRGLQRLPISYRAARSRG
jgi:cytochrome P450